MGKRKQKRGGSVAGKQNESNETVTSEPTPSTSRNRPVPEPKGKPKNKTSPESKTGTASSVPVDQPPMRMRTRRMAANESGQGNSPNSSMPQSTAIKPKIVPVPVSGQEHKKLAVEEVSPAPKKGRKAKQERNTTSSSLGASIPAIAGTSKSKSKVLSRAELIQLEAEQIPSVKTSMWNPFTLFPKEVWELIFNNLADPKDMANVMNSTPEWREMYLPKRTILLFPQVLSLMAETECGNYDDHYLLRDDYINCRLVNRSWDQSVQNYIQNHPVHTTLDYLEEEDNMIDTYELFNHQYWQKEVFEWYCPEGMEGFLENFESSHPSSRNPFLCRQITLQDIELALPTSWIGPGYEPQADLATTQLCWSTIVKMLDNYGSHVWHCIINYKFNLTPLTWYVHMQQWISLMPNLKVLDLQYRFTCSLEPNELTELDNQIAVNPISTLNNLILLKTEDVPGPVFNELIRNAPNLKKLQIKLSGRKTGKRLCHYDLAQLSNHQLTEACLTLVAPEDFRHLETTLPSWPLKILYIDLRYEGGDWKKDCYPTWPDWTGIFGMLSDKFGSTLTELKLRLPKASSEKDKKRILSDNLQYRLNLPHLDELRVVVPNLSSFDFLLPLKSSLKHLILIVEHHEYEDGRKKKAINELKKNEILKFTGNFDKLFEANVFKEMTALQYIQVYVSLKPKLPSNRVQDKFAAHEYYNYKNYNNYNFREF